MSHLLPEWFEPDVSDFIASWILRAYLEVLSGEGSPSDSLDWIPFSSVWKRLSFECKTSGMTLAEW